VSWEYDDNLVVRAANGDAVMDDLELGQDAGEVVAPEL
jgi:hypothetical protein